MVAICLISILIAFISEHLFLGLMIALFLLLSFSYELFKQARYFVNISQLVTSGISKIAHPEKISANRTRLNLIVGWYFCYSFKLDNNTYENKFWVPLKILSTKPCNIDEIEILYDPQNPKNSIPNIPEWDQFNLKLATH